MKIAFVIGSLSFSGAEKVLSIVAQELFNQGNDIHVILLEKEKGLVEVEQNLMTYGAKTTGMRLIRLFSRWSVIRDTLKTINPDVVVAFGSVCNVNTIMATIGLRYPLVICERNDPNYDPRKGSEKLIRSVLYPFADGYVFQTERIKDYFSKRIQNKAVVIPNPIIDSGKRWKLFSSTKRIISIARLDDYQKDQSLMIKAFTKFSVKHPEYQLVLYGDGPDRKKYMDLIECLGMRDKIVLPGKTNNPIKELLDSEIFLLTSVFEGMPNALMEAMSVGIPCVSTDCGGGGAYDLVNIYGAGILVPCGDIDSIVESLSLLVEDNALMNELSSKSITINTKLGRENVSRQWMDYLEKITKE